MRMAERERKRAFSLRKQPSQDTTGRAAHSAFSPLDEGSPGLEETGDPPSQRLLETETWRSSTELVWLSSVLCPPPSTLSPYGDLGDHGDGRWFFLSSLPS